MELKQKATTRQLLGSVSSSLWKSYSPASDATSEHSGPILGASRPPNGENQLHAPGLSAYAPPYVVSTIHPAYSQLLSSIQLNTLLVSHTSMCCRCRLFTCCCILILYSSRTFVVPGSINSIINQGLKLVNLQQIQTNWLADVFQELGNVPFFVLKLYN